jgi:hypothetical protein
LLVVEYGKMRAAQAAAQWHIRQFQERMHHGTQ